MRNSYIFFVYEYVIKCIIIYISAVFSFRTIFGTTFFFFNRYIFKDKPNIYLDNNEKIIFYLEF